MGAPLKVVPSTHRTSKHRLMLMAGVVVAVQMILVVLVDGATRPGYNPWRHWVSHLSLGDRGWIGTVNLTVCALLTLTFGLGLRRALPPGRAGRWSAILVLLIGVGFVLTAIFPIDQGLGFPADTEPMRTATGSLHDLGGGMVFIGLTAASAVLGRALRPAFPKAGLVGAVVAVAVGMAFVACSVLSGLDFAGKMPNAPSGFMEKVALFIGQGWLAVAGLHLLRRVEH